MEKIADPYFFSCQSAVAFWSYAPLKNQNEILSARYLEKYLRYGLETWSADKYLSYGLETWSADKG